ncbi:IS1/IS1595 family N-terminal zinc-binding domain-containing protein [Desulforhabdus amnigena]|uniref:IS1/IS1595 family N-terminal zinc-binding domain-containing protein n=1 Tax=Desulforhabdus amnigena TaxID=40218 RepID=UPI0035A21AF5
MAGVKCPRCGAETVYRYGKTKQGKQRYLCLACGLQFTPGSRRVEPAERPVCPACGKPMHVYKRENGATRFRCSNYPECKCFKKILEKETK